MTTPTNQSGFRILNDVAIRALCQNVERPMISPFFPEKMKTVQVNGVSVPALSYGTGHYGYDIRLDTQFMFLLPNSPDDFIYDTKTASDPALWNKVESEHFLLTPGHFVLGQSSEYFMMPNNVIGVVWGKSSLARGGILVNVTPLEPGWNGYLTISISNTGQFPVKLYAGEGIAQIVFFESDQTPEQLYSGKYQNQNGITVGRV